MFCCARCACMVFVHDALNDARYSASSLRCDRRPHMSECKNDDKCTRSSAAARICRQTTVVCMDEHVNRRSILIRDHSLIQRTHTIRERAPANLAPSGQREWRTGHGACRQFEPFDVVLLFKRICRTNNTFFIKREQTGHMTNEICDRR